MKKRLLLLFAVLILLLAACGARDPLRVETEGIVSAQLWADGETREITDEDELEELAEIIGSIELKPVTVDIAAPGAVAVRASITYADGTQCSLSYPCCEAEGRTWAAANDCIEKFAVFFE